MSVLDVPKIYARHVYKQTYPYVCNVNLDLHYLMVLVRYAHQTVHHAHHQFLQSVSNVHKDLQQYFKTMLQHALVVVLAVYNVIKPIHQYV